MERECRSWILSSIDVVSSLPAVTERGLGGDLSRLCSAFKAKGGCSCRNSVMSTWAVGQANAASGRVADLFSPAQDGSGGDRRIGRG